MRYTVQKPRDRSGARTKIETPTRSNSPKTYRYRKPTRKNPTSSHDTPSHHTPSNFYFLKNLAAAPSYKHTTEAQPQQKRQDPVIIPEPIQWNRETRRAAGLRKTYETADFIPHRNQKNYYSTIYSRNRTLPAGKGYFTSPPIHKKPKTPHLPPLSHSQTPEQHTPARYGRPSRIPAHYRRRTDLTRHVNAPPDLLWTTYRSVP